MFTSGLLRRALALQRASRSRAGRFPTHAFALSAAQNSHQNTPPSAPSRVPLCFALAGAAAGASRAAADDGESTPPWRHTPQAALRWSAIVDELAAVQAATPRAGGFVAKRRRAETARDGEEVWAYRLEFAAGPDAPVLDVFSSLVHAFCGRSSAEISSSELSSRTVLRASRGQGGGVRGSGKGFELSVTVPRHGQFDRSVVLEVLRDGSDAMFSANEVAAVLRAYQITQESQVEKDVVNRRTTSTTQQHHRARSQSIDSPPIDTELFDHFAATAAAVMAAAALGEGGVHHGDHDRMVRLLGGILDGNFDTVSEVNLGEVREDEPHELDDSAVLRVKNSQRKLEDLGAEVFVPGPDVSWDDIAGYESTKQLIEETIVLPLAHRDIYQCISAGTRKKPEAIVPRAVLLHGPPGCGKTLLVRVLAANVGVPLVNLRLESLLSKFYGETTKTLAAVLDATKELGPCLIFLDEAEALAPSRSGPDTHEVTRQTLSVLLRHLDGLDGAKESVLVCATNVPGMLDSALVSRMDAVIRVGLPDATAREAILGRYAVQLSRAELEMLAAKTSGFSGRELKDACMSAERAAAARELRRREQEGSEDENVKSSHGVSLPSMDDYAAAIARKAESSIGGLANEDARNIHL
jgi:SpoVK/Ycf46/Vps4 family AAA+-type ATPase